MTSCIHIPVIREVLTMEEKMDDEELWKGLKKALDGAIAQFVQTRTVEGENLKKDLIAKLDGMLGTGQDRLKNVHRRSLRSTEKS